MKLREMLHQLKTGSEFVVKGAGVVTCNLQAAALGRTLGAERCNDDVASGLDGMRYLANVRSAILGSGQKMEHRPVMPNVVPVPHERKCRNVTAKPVDLVRTVTKSLFSHIQRSQRNIQNRKLVISARQQVVD